MTTETSAPMSDDYTPMTDVRWDDFRRTGLRPKRLGHGQQELSWEALCDLGHELADPARLTVEEARRLVDFTVSGLPMVITWETRLGAELKSRVETRTTTVIVDYVFPPGVEDPKSCPGYLFVRHCGFAHTIYLSQVMSIRNVESFTSYRPANEED